MLNSVWKMKHQRRALYQSKTLYIVLQQEDVVAAVLCMPYAYPMHASNMMVHTEKHEKTSSVKFWGTLSASGKGNGLGKLDILLSISDLTACGDNEDLLLMRSWAFESVYSYVDVL
jgi:hypothetical protein